MTRVVYVISTLQRCGPVNVLFDIVNNLPKGFDSIIVTLAPEPADSRYRDFLDITSDIICLFDNRIESATGTLAIRRCLKRLAPDIVHAHGWRACKLCSNLSYPTVVTVHNSLFDDFKTAYGPFLGAVMAWLQARWIKTFDAVVTCSAATQDVLAQSYGIASTVIRNGVDQTRFFPLDEQSRGILRKDLSIPDNALVFISTGGFIKRKRNLDVIKAFEQIPSDHHLMLMMLGDGGQYDEASRLASDSVLILGRRDDVAKWLQVSDCYISNSEAEGFPLAVMEAISCGLPAILSPIAPHKEILSIAGVESVRLMAESSISPSDFFQIPKRPHHASTSAFTAVTMAESYAQLYIKHTDIKHTGENRMEAGVLR